MWWGSAETGGPPLPPGLHSAPLAAGVCPRLQTPRPHKQDCHMIAAHVPRPAPSFSLPPGLFFFLRHSLPSFLPASSLLAPRRRSFPPSLLPPCLPSVRLSPPAAGSVRPQSEGASQRARRGSAVHRPASGRGVRPGVGRTRASSLEEITTNPRQNYLGKMQLCLLAPSMLGRPKCVVRLSDLFFWCPRRGPRPLPFSIEGAGAHNCIFPS